jgi:glycosyltransferase involved in cell wall biosynthesis
MKYLLKSVEKNAQKFDIAFFTWPYFMNFPKINCPQVAVFHDFNFKYFFGTHIFDQQSVKMRDANIKKWIEHCIPVVSNNFMHGELKKFYPDAKDVYVIHLPSINPTLFFKDEVSPTPVFKNEYGKYFLCSSHAVVHKNIGNIIAALYLLNRDRTEKIKLVITGSGTETITGKSDYLSLVPAAEKYKDVIGMGYVSDTVHDSLVLNSIAVINASLYEAGNGVGLDAWQLGVPVLQSTIPAFREHLEHQGYRAFEFDPKDPQSIVNAMRTCIENKEMREENVAQSLEAAKLNNWKTAAKKYIDMFEHAIHQA